MLLKIDRLLLRVPSLPAAVKYYGEVLGLRVVKQDARLATLHFAGDSHGASTELVLHCDPDLPAQGVYFLVDDVRAAYRRREELKLTFVSPPTRIARGYRATVKDPFGLVLLFLDRSDDAPSHHFETEDAKPAGSLFAGVTTKMPAKKALLVKLYVKVGRTADDLPYTPEFENLYGPYAAAYGEQPPERAEVWRHLLNLRKKSGNLPKLGDARSPAPDVPPEVRDELREKLKEDIGKRDRLPYTPRFDEIADEFNRALKRPLSPHLVWRLIATLAK